MATHANETMKARKKHWFTNDSKLFRRNGDLLCDVHMHADSNTGEIRVGGERLYVRHRARSPRWRLVRTVGDQNEVLLCAHRWQSDTFAYIVERRALDGTLLARFRIKERALGGDVFDVHELPVTAALVCTEVQSEEDPVEKSGDVTVAVDEMNTPADDSSTPTEATPDAEGQLVVTFTSRHHSRKYNVDAHKQLDDEMFSFMFFLFVMLNRVKGFNRHAGSGDAAAMFAATAPVLVSVNAATF